MPYDAKCKWCGKMFEKPALLSIKSAYQGDRRNYCSTKCFNEATNTSGGNNSSSGGGSNSPTIVNQKSEAEIEAMEDARIEAKVDSISKISYGSDINQVQDVLNQLTTIGASKPDTNVRKAIVEKMEFGIMKLKNAGLAAEAEFFETKMKKIKPKWYD
jgi:hypothetical protein